VVRVAGFIDVLLIEISEAWSPGNFGYRGLRVIGA